MGQHVPNGRLKKARSTTIFLGAISSCASFSSLQLGSESEQSLPQSPDGWQPHDAVPIQMAGANERAAVLREGGGKGNKGTRRKTLVQLSYWVAMVLAGQWTPMFQSKLWSSSAEKRMSQTTIGQTLLAVPGNHAFSSNYATFDTLLMCKCSKWAREVKQSYITCRPGLHRPVLAYGWD